MLPNHMHEHFESEVNAFCSAISAPEAPGDQGAFTTGMQGIGVSTPIAAEVAAATCGFAWVLHIPKGAMLSIGMLSITVAGSVHVEQRRCPDLQRPRGRVVVPLDGHTMATPIK